MRDGCVVAIAGSPTFKLLSCMEWEQPWGCMGVWSMYGDVSGSLKQAYFQTHAGLQVLQTKEV